MNKSYFVFGAVIILALGIVISNEPENINDNVESEAAMIQKTQNRAKLVAKRLIKNHFEQKQFILNSEANPQERGLASENSGEIVETVKKSLEGEVARDPWGHPFKYKVIGDGNPSTGSKVVILSAGPNEKMESDLKTLNSESANADDIAVVVSI